MIENGRLARAAERAIRRLGPGQFMVQGHDEPVYYVDLSVDPPCTCKDQEYHGAGCLHELAARLQEHDPSVMHHIVEQIMKREARKAEATTARRPRRERGSERNRGAIAPDVID